MMFVVNSRIPKFFTYHENLLTKTETSQRKQLLGNRGFFSQRDNNFSELGWNTVQSIKKLSESQMLEGFA